MQKLKGKLVNVNAIVDFAQIAEKATCLITVTVSHLSLNEKK